ncbi:MAG: YjjG family noncanonical pyrimidine nucleotidase [Candidatus Cloacimonetes bacterium]|nr:YjjG family noncanonical pyrimidine nucleotidase [Candidatus Cloacimonadota bacterium]MBS3767172.1 YjjG family noncanonical pyrimidine nucleotidase [Candidatus Cloacimonadota bacterium]
MHYNFILFDLDGTIFDFHKAEEYALKKLFQFFNIKGDFEELKNTYIDINLSTWEEFRKQKISAAELKTKRFKLFSNKINMQISPQEFSRMYQKFLSESADLLDGAKEALDSLKQQNIELVLITNGLADVQNRRLQNSTIKKYFSDLFISEEIGYAKPHPKIFEHIFQKFFSAEKDKTLIVGDNLESDIKGGNDFGIKTCWFNPNSVENVSTIVPDYEITQLREIAHIIEI